MNEKSSKTEPLLLNVMQVARLLGVSKRTVYRLVSAGEFPPPIRVSSSSRWRKTAVIEWIASQELK